MATKKSAKSAKSSAPRKSQKPRASKGTSKKVQASKKATSPARQLSTRGPLIGKTYWAKPGEHSTQWRIIDASGATLGRLSSFVAHTLMGKHRPEYTRSSDTGDHVIVVNAEKIVVTGSKETDKFYHRHTNYPGGLKSHSVSDVRTNHPERLVQLAVHRMLPKGHMGRRWFKKLRVFAGDSHPHTAQKPQWLKIPAGATTNSNKMGAA